MLASVCGLLLNACGGDDPKQPPDDSGPPVATIELAAASAGHLTEGIELLEDLAEGADAQSFHQAQERLADLGKEVRRSANDADQESPIQRRLGKALDQLSEAAGELVLVSRDMSKTAELREREQEPSEEAQASLEAASTRVDRLTVRIGDAEMAFENAYALLRDALDDLGDDPALGDGARRVRDLGRRLGDLESTLGAGFDALRRTLSTEARALAARSEELTPEPPDVVLDCTSAYSTVSDLSVRNMSCAEADGIVIQAIPVLAPGFVVAGFSCSILGEYGPPGGPILGATDIRCESGDQAFRFGFAD